MLIGLTGGAGSGKSSVAKLLRKQGVKILDLDKVIMTIYKEKGEVFNLLVETCGEGILKNGEIERNYLRDKLRKLSEKKKNFLKQRELDEIKKRIEEFKEKHKLKKRTVLEGARILEDNIKTDKLILLVCKPQLRKERIRQRNKGIPEEIINKIVQGQLTNKAAKLKAKENFPKENLLIVKNESNLKVVVEKINKKFRIVNNEKTDLQ
jgi:dephospho-CoA kinase